MAPAPEGRNQHKRSEQMGGGRRPSMADVRRSPSNEGSSAVLPQRRPRYVALGVKNDMPFYISRNLSK